MRPFSTPGPSSTLGTTSPVRSRRPLWLVGATAQNGDTFVDTELRRVESPSLAFVPFSTPGPLRSPVHFDYDVVSETALQLEKPAPASSPLSPDLQIRASRPLGYAESPESTTRGDILASPALAMPASFSALPPRRLLLSASDFVPFTAPGPTVEFRDAVALSPYMLSDISRPLSPGVTLAPHNDIDFQWCRFDRNRIAEGTSSPIGFSVENSEETFWSQPAPKAPYMKEHLERDLPTDSMRDLHSFPTPSTHARRCSPQSRRLTDNAAPKPDIPPDASSKLTQTCGDNIRGDNENPFVWIVPPRDVPPSTPPRNIVQDSIDDTGRATPPVQEAPVSSRCIPQDNDAVVSEGVDTNAPDRRRRPPFAPAPGVYVSPLRGSDSSPRMAIDAKTSAAAQRYNEGDCHSVDQQTSDERELQLIEEAIEEADSQPGEKVTLSHDDDVQDDIEEFDELGGCSQDSRDTIESWTK
ncbi:hypothetical protein PYCCODRAFT_1474157 [Trametes coccinea BRFM310]|uniref:Uncharacterized protein n=1 Tax=Trametes coccinea (strain BRFM310) TaxID=1353009 RepID=A0A1Y2J1D3_TRAC3|nr:hypothetical protein PYCCODRAFT_1474157 [Trametes coccinea BRFM310]